MSRDLGARGISHRPLEGLRWPPMTIFHFLRYPRGIIVAQLSDVNQGPRLEVVKDVSNLCFLGEFGGKGDCCASRRLDVGAICYLYRRACRYWLDVCAILTGGRDQVVARGSGIGYSR